MKGSVDITN